MAEMKNDEGFDIESINPSDSPLNFEDIQLDDDSEGEDEQSVCQDEDDEL